MHLFYQPNFSQITALTDDEAFHAAKVLRLREGESVQVTDGKGSWYEAVVQSSTPKNCILKVTNQILQPPRKYHIEIALAPTKNMDRIEWFVEKATEIGIDKISFFYTKHSERKTLKLERIHKIAVSAMKQSLQAYLPEVAEVGDFEKWIVRQSDANTQKWIAHLPENEVPLHLLKAATAGERYTVLIGPEGDFAASEIALAQIHGFRMATLGNTRLRTETAALAACQVLHHVNI